MIVYQLHIAPGEGAGEGEDHDQWFSSLEAARRARRQLIAQSEGTEPPGSEDFAIKRWRVAALSRKRLALAILNRRGWAEAAGTIVIDPHVFGASRCAECGAAGSPANPVRFIDATREMFACHECRNPEDWGADWGDAGPAGP